MSNLLLRPRPLVDPQELARRNNEAAAGHQLLAAKRRRRRRRKRAGALPGDQVSDSLLDALDRLEAPSAARPTRAVGFFLPKKPH